MSDMIASELVKLAKAVVASGEAYDVYNEREKMMWRGKWGTAHELIRDVKEALPNGYNEFDAERLENAIRMVGGSFEFQFAREYSATVYVRRFKDVEDVKRLVLAFRAARADELSVERGGEHIMFDDGVPADFEVQAGDEFRAWWD